MYSANQRIRAWTLTLTVLASISSLLQKPIAPGKPAGQSRARETVTSAATAPNRTRQVAAQAAYGKLPLQFEANQGQSDAQVKFLARGSGYTLFLTATEAVLALTQHSEVKSPHPAPQPQPPAVVRLQLAGANPQPHITGKAELPGKSHYFFGNDPARWHTNIPTYARVQYEDVYPGIDLVYYGTQRQVEYDFIVAPGADPTAIRLAFAGLVGAGLKPAPTLDGATGDLVLNAASGELRFHQPRIYQDINGTKQPIAGRYVLFDPETADSGPRTQQVGFEVAAYDTSKPLIIDPVLVYSTYLGGSDLDEGHAIAVDIAGNAYVTGSTLSPDFPAPNPMPPDPARGSGLFIVKLNATGSALLYSVFLGGLAGADVQAVAVDTAGNAYISGSTLSGDFPTTAGAFDTTHNAPGEFPDAFVTKLNPTGSVLIYSTFLGGSRQNLSNAIAVDAAGNAYVTGSTFSADFPTTAGAFDTSYQPFNGTKDHSDAFVTKLNPTGSALVYSTFLGGNLDDNSGTDIAVDASGNAYVTGFAYSLDFPRTNVLRAAITGPFVTKLNPTGAALIYSTLVDQGGAIAVDSVGNAYTAGNGGVAKLDPAGSALVYSIPLPGDIEDIAIDTAGNAYITGSTDSLDFPLVNPLQAGPGRSLCPSHPAFVTLCPTAFVTKVNATGTAFLYSTYLGGSGGEGHSDFGKGIAVDAAGNAYVTGSTTSPDFPTVNPLQPMRGIDAFVAKIADGPPGLMAFLESPEDGPVSGIVVIRGWAFATEPGEHISNVELFIDGQRAGDIPGVLLGDIPCCSERKDVQAAFPQFPAENTLGSGWGLTFNWGLLSSGSHTVRVKITDTKGEIFLTDTRSLTVVRPGESEFLDQFDLSDATAGIAGEELSVEGVIIRDKITQQRQRINTRFRWKLDTQALGMTQAETVALLSSSRPPFSAFVASLPTWSLGWPIVGSAQAAPGLTTAFESPAEGQVVAGVALIRGWAFPEEAQISINQVTLLVDGQPSGTAPCCSGRGDVAAAFPGNPNAFNSGWGTVFNYGTLSPGIHTIGVQIMDSTGMAQTSTHTVQVVRVGGSEFLDQFDLSNATARIAGENIILSGVVVRDKASQQTETVEVWLRWFEASQGLGVVATSG